jgi:hypothetical protein
VKALLRFQGVALTRTISNRFVVIGLPLVLVGTWMSVREREPIHSTIWALESLFVVVVLALWGMTRTFEALDVVRWTLPLDRRRLLRSHFGFWLAVAAPPATIVAVVHAADVLGAAVLLVHLALFVVAAAALVMFFQRVSRPGVGLGGIVSGVVVGSVLVWPAGWSFYLAWSGRAESLILIAVVAGVSWAIGVPSFLREELAPAAAAAATASRPSRSDADGSIAARTPVATVMRAAYPPFLTALWIVFGGVLPLLFAWTTIFVIYAPIAGSNLAGAALQSWRWLAATPISRDRAFRILFGPALAFVLVVTGARLVLVETTGDRSAFFRDHRRDDFALSDSATLELHELLEFQPDGRAYLTPDASRIATRLQRHFRESYGLAVPKDRIEADILRGWPEQPSTGIMDSDQTAVLDAMERVRVDLADDIAGATRRRDLAVAAGLVLAFLVMLRLQFAGRLLGVFLVILVGLPLAMLALFRRDVPAFAEASDKLYAAMTGASSTVFWLALVAACALGALLWRSARAAFRRIDLLDLPPSPPAWMRS